MNAELVTIGVRDNGCPAARHVEGLNREPHLMTPEVFDRLLEVVYFQYKVWTVA